MGVGSAFKMKPSSVSVWLLAILFSAQAHAYHTGHSVHKRDADVIEPSTQDVEDNDAPVDYTGTQLWKVSIEKGLRLIKDLTQTKSVAVWGGNHSTVDVMVTPDMLQNVSQVLRSNNITYNVVIEDLQRLINEENPPLDEEQLELQNRNARAYNFWRYRVIGPRRRMSLIGAYLGHNSLDENMEYWPNANWGHRMTWLQYHRVSDIYGYLDHLAATYPKHCSVQTVGKSYQGREIKVLRISNGKPGNKAIWIDGGIHAREWISPATVTYFINQFAENFDVESQEVQNIDWYFMPVVNPDGYEYTHTTNRLWRKNRSGASLGRCAGVDLNRNFGYKWGGKGTSSRQCDEIYRGKSAFSEPESKALADFITNSGADFRAYLSYHSYGQYLLYPWGYDAVVPPDHTDLQSLGEKMNQVMVQNGGTRYQVGASSILLYPAAGASDDWAKAQGIKYSYTIELRDTGRYGFVLPASQIIPTAKESLAALRVVASRVILEN